MTIKDFSLALSLSLSLSLSTPAQIYSLLFSLGDIFSQPLSFMNCLERSDYNIRLFSEEIEISGTPNYYDQFIEHIWLFPSHLLFFFN